MDKLTNFYKTKVENFYGITYCPDYIRRFQKKMDSMRPRNHYMFADANGFFFYKPIMIGVKNSISNKFFTPYRETEIYDSYAKIKSDEKFPR